MAHSETNPNLSDINEATYVKVTASSDNTEVKIFLPDGTYESDNPATGATARTQTIASNGSSIIIQKLPTDVITCAAGLCEKVDVNGDPID